MERKTKQRILGIFVVIGLVIISLPLFQTGKDVKTQTALVKAPPFPDQPVQVSANPPAQAEAAPVPTQVTINLAEATPVITTQTANSNGVNQQPDDTIPTSSNTDTTPKQAPAIPTPNLYSTTTENADDEDAALTSTPSKPADIAPTAEAKPVEHLQVKAPAETTTETTLTEESITPGQRSAENTVAPVKPVVAHKAKSVKTAKIDIKTAQSKPRLRAGVVKSFAEVMREYHTPKVRVATSSLHAPLDSDGLFKLKNAVWVIQLGSFKNKTNALRLVNQLRASGYPAFIQEVASNTRVYVGPETKQVAARSLATRLEADMKLRGIVVSYKPLSL